jgi:hypothetical protein
VNGAAFVQSSHGSSRPSSSTLFIATGIAQAVPPEQVLQVQAGAPCFVSGCSLHGYVVTVWRN